MLIFLSVSNNFKLKDKMCFISKQNYFKKTHTSESQFKIKKIHGYLMSKKLDSLEREALELKK